MMKKRVLPILLMALLLIFSINIIQSCVSSLFINSLYHDLGNRDWRIQLGYGYTIQQMNADEIILIKDGWQDANDIVIPITIYSYCCNSRYAGFICKDTDGENGLPNTDDKLQYYLVDMQADILSGPFSADFFHEYCTINGFFPELKWINTSPRPENASFY